MLRLIYSSVVLFCLLQSLRAYQIPTPHILASLKGLEVTIPHESGITSVHVEVSRNSNTTTDNSSTWAGQSLLSDDYTNWVYQTVSARFEVGDILHCRISVTKDNQKYDKNVSVPIADNSDSPASSYTIPSPTIEVYHKGFELFIPHKYGISFVFVEVKLNEKITTLLPSTWTGFCSLSDHSTHWVYRNPDAKLRLGDTLYYRIMVTKDGQLHTAEDGVYNVDHHAIDTPLNAGKTTRISIKAHRRNFRISMPHEKGITHVKAEVIHGTGTPPGNSKTWEGLFSLSYDKKNWVYQNYDARLKPGDTFNIKFSIRKGHNLYLGESKKVKLTVLNEISDDCFIS